jgi:hypothetical protein
VSRSAARWSAVTRAAAALEISAPGCPPSPAQRGVISANSVGLRGLSDAFPSSGLPHIGTARSPHSMERTHGLSSGRLSLL